MKTAEYIAFTIDRLPKGYVFTYADFTTEVSQKEAVVKAVWQNCLFVFYLTYSCSLKFCDTIEVLCSAIFKTKTDACYIKMEFRHKAFLQIQTE